MSEYIVYQNVYSCMQIMILRLLTAECYSLIKEHVVLRTDTQVCANTAHVGQDALVGYKCLSRTRLIDSCQQVPGPQIHYIVQTFETFTSLCLTETFYEGPAYMKIIWRTAKVHWCRSDEKFISWKVCLIPTVLLLYYNDHIHTSVKSRLSTLPLINPSLIKNNHWPILIPCVPK